MAIDLTAGKPIRVLLAFSLPMLIGNVVQQLYNMVDLMVVGRFVGVNALAAVGATGSTMFLVFSLVIGLTNGASVVIGQYFGYGDQERTRQAVATAVWVLSAAAVILTVVGVAVTRPALTLMNTPPEIIDGAVDYLRIIFFGVAATVAYNTAANILRAIGDSVTPLVFLILAALLNIGLDLLFVIVFHMGVGGAAWATIIAQAIAAVACIVYAIHKKPILHLARRHFQLDHTILGQTVKLGIPGAIQQSLISIGSMTVQSVVNSFGPQVVAAYAGATKLDQLAVQPLLSLSMGAGTYAAQNMGAGKIHRIRRGFWSAAGLCAIFCGVMTPVLFLFGGRMMRLFVDGSEAAVLMTGQQYLRTVSLFYIVVGVLLVLENMLRGVGDVIAPMFSNAAEIVVRIAAAYTLAAALGHTGVWWSGPISWIAGTLICFSRYASGKWQFKALVSGPVDAEGPESRQS